MVVFAVIFYGPLILFSYLVLLWRHGWDLFTPEPGWILYSFVAVLLAGGVVLFSWWAGRRFSWARDMEREFIHVLGALEPLDVVALAVLSGIGEEAFFRGVLQPKLGLVVTSLIFGSVHFPFSVRMIPWTIFAGAMGVALGLLFQASGSLIPPILAHALVNGINLMALSARAQRLGIPRRRFGDLPPDPPDPDGSSL